MDPNVWRFLGFGSSIVGFICFALGSSFHKLFGQWNLWKIVVYSNVSFIFTALTLIADYIRQRFPRVFWWKTQVVFLALMFSCLYSYYDDRSNEGEAGKKEYTCQQSILSLISFGAFALMSMSLSTRVQPGFEVGMSNFFLTCLVVGVMKMNFNLGVAVAVVCHVVMSIRSWSDSREEQGQCGDDQLHQIVVVGDNLHDNSDSFPPPVLLDNSDSFPPPVNPPFPIVPHSPNLSENLLSTPSLSEPSTPLKIFPKLTLEPVKLKLNSLTLPMIQPKLKLEPVPPVQFFKQGEKKCTGPRSFIRQKEGFCKETYWLVRPKKKV